MENIEKVNDDTELQKSEKMALVQHEKTAINSHSFFFFNFTRLFFSFLRISLMLCAWMMFHLHT